MTTWITPVNDRTLNDIAIIKQVAQRITSVGWNDNSAQNILDKMFWFTGSTDGYVLNSSDAVLFDSDGNSLIILGEYIPIKGVFNYTDINRIIDNTIHLRDKLSLYGYTASFTDQAHVTMEDLPYLTQTIFTIKTNILTLLSAYYSFTYSTIDTSATTLDYVDANSMEGALLSLYQLIDNMIAEFKYCGTFYSADDISL